MSSGRVLILAAFCMMSLAGCAPANVPSTASPHWSLKDGFYWTWSRPAVGGCVSWLATKEWASVQATLDIPCEKFERGGGAHQRGLYYFTVLDDIDFKGYWPWSAEICSQQIVYDNKGMIAEILPCPYRLSDDQIEELMTFIGEPQAKAFTDGEKRTLSRIKERLGQVKGDALSSSQFGCTDRARRDSGGHRMRFDAWRAV